MRAMAEGIVSLLYPRRCPLCQDILPRGAAYICKSCRRKAMPIREPKCKRCGKPISEQEQEFCTNCLGREHSFSKGWIVFPYEKEIKRSVHQFKFHNKREYKDFFASEMVRVYGKEICFWHPDVMAPIPMFRKKKNKRGYDQAELLACEVGRLLDIPVERKLLCRIRSTVPQKELNRREREKNLRDAFKACLKGEPPKRVLLVDDIYTTGATVDAAAGALLAEGVSEVRLLALCTGRADD